MINKNQQEVLEELAKLNHGKVLREFLEEEMSKIGDIKTCKTWEETQGRKIALETLERLFSFLKIKNPVAKSKTLYN